MFYAYQKLILMLASQIMTTAWKFPAVIYAEQTSEMRCIYYRNSLPLKLITIQHLQDCINFKIGGKQCRFVSTYHLPNKSQNDFESFGNNFKSNNDAVTANKPPKIF